MEWVRLFHTKIDVLAETMCTKGWRLARCTPAVDSCARRRATAAAGRLGRKTSRCALAATLGLGNGASLARGGTRSARSLKLGKRHVGNFLQNSLG